MRRSPARVLGFATLFLVAGCQSSGESPTAAPGAATAAAPGAATTPGAAATHGAAAATHGATAPGAATGSAPAAPGGLAALAGLGGGGGPVCPKLQRIVAGLVEKDRATVDRRYEPLPAPPAPTGKHYLLPLGGLFLPLPARDYEIRIATEGVRGKTRLRLFLLSPDSVVGIHPGIGDEPIDDLFARAGDRPRDRPTDETLRLFGKAPSAFDLRREGYRVRASDFRCDEARRDEAVRQAVVLVLKSLGESPQGARVHENVARPGSLLVTGTSPKGHATASLMIPSADGGIELSLTALTPASTAALPSLLGAIRAQRPTLDAAPPPPALPLAVAAAAGDRQAAVTLATRPDLSPPLATALRSFLQ